MSYEAAEAGPGERKAEKAARPYSDCPRSRAEHALLGLGLADAAIRHCRRSTSTGIEPGIGGGAGDAIRGEAFRDKLSDRLRAGWARLRLPSYPRVERR